MTVQLFSKQVEKLNSAVRKSMSQRRYLHVLGVTHTVLFLAEIHKIDLPKAALAGLLHDISKEISFSQIDAELTKLGQPIGAEDRPFPRTWHGLHAATIAPQKFDIHDPDILHAVAQHTTGDAEMSLLSRLLFIADFCEPGRRMTEAPEILRLARKNITAGFCRTLDQKTRHMLNKPDFHLHPRTWRCIQHWLPKRAEEIQMQMNTIMAAGQSYS